MLLMLVFAATLRTTAVLFSPKDSLPFPGAYPEVVQEMPSPGLCIVIPPKALCYLPHPHHLCLLMSEDSEHCSCCGQGVCSDCTVLSDIGNNMTPAPTKPPPQLFKPASVYLAVLLLQHGVREAGVGLSKAPI